MNFWYQMQKYRYKNEYNLEFLTQIEMKMKKMIKRYLET